MLNLFQQILNNELSLPKDPSSKDLVALITFILRKFFKQLEETPFLLVEAFFPKNRSVWKKLSTRTGQADSSDSDEDDGLVRPQVVSGCRNCLTNRVGRSTSWLLQTKKPAGSKRRSRVVDPDRALKASGPRKRKEKIQEERANYKSARLIEVSLFLGHK